MKKLTTSQRNDLGKLLKEKTDIFVDFLDDSTVERNLIKNELEDMLCQVGTILNSDVYI